MEKGDSEYRIVYLGPPATHTHVACLNYFKEFGQKIPKDSIQEVFKSVEHGEAEYGVVPVENSIEGSVNITLDLFIESEIQHNRDSGDELNPNKYNLNIISKGVKVCGEIMIQVSHYLLSKSGRPEIINRIYSHPQALEQCRNWLKKNLFKIELVETSSTAKASQMAAEDPEGAAIGSILASSLYRLKIIHSKIEDYPHNYTRFWVIGHKIGESTGNDKTSILFSIPHIPGSLHRALGIFSNQSINLTKIESRPMKHKPWEYIFFIDFEGHVMDPKVHEALTQLKENVSLFKLLGSYPQCNQSNSDKWWGSLHTGEDYPP